MSGVSSKQKRVFGAGRSPTKFSFTYEDYAEILGCSVQAARKHAQRGNFDPKDLVSVLEFISRRLKKGELSLGEVMAKYDG